MKPAYEKRGKYINVILGLLVIVLCVLCLFAGSSGMSFSEGLPALLGKGSLSNIRIIRNIRLPRVLAAAVAGAGLSLSGLIMQTVLGNPMASPATLGVANAAVFGANLSIIVFAGGFLSLGNNLSAYTVGANPFATSLSAFFFAMLSVLLILALCRIRLFAAGAVVLAGLSVGAVWTAATSVLQFYATDVGLSAAVIWSFGDLGRATFKTDAVMFFTVLAGFVVFYILSPRLNALLSGDAAARSMGVNVGRLRFVSLLFASIMTATCVSFLGIIAFVGIICPHSVKKFLGEDHRFVVPASAFAGSILLVLSDAFSRSVGGGAAIPVGAVTSLLGAPFFVALIFSGKGEADA